MKQYFLKVAGASAIFALMATGSFAQEEKTENPRRRADDVIIIKPKTDTNTKLTIEINGADVKVNGKPLTEFKNDNVTISLRRDNQRLALMDDMRAPRNRFRGGLTTYSYGNSDNVTVTGFSTNKAFLGVGTEKADEGIVIRSVTEESAAAKAGLKEGDVITKINDTKINSPEELTQTIGKFKPDEKITITYKRDKKETKTTAVLTKRKNVQGFELNAPEYQEFKNFNYDNNGNNFSFNWMGKPKLGLKAQETEDGKGLKVLDVDDESPAEKAGIKEGDIITTFDGTEVNNIDQLRDLSKPAIEKGTFMVKLTRDGKQQELQVKIPKNLKTGSL
jgi:serine protease Do